MSTPIETPPQTRPHPGKSALAAERRAQAPADEPPAEPGETSEPESSDLPTPRRRRDSRVQE